MGNAFKSLFGRRQTRVLMLGLDNAGKSTVLHTLKTNGSGGDFESVPTVGFAVETIKIRNVTLNVWDVGGQDRIRPLWRHYFIGTDALIYVVDSSDVGRMEEAKTEFQRIVTDNEMQEAVVLVLANKQDMEQALPAEEVGSLLEVGQLEGRCLSIRGVCAKDGQGLVESIDWMAQEINTRRKGKKKKKKTK